MTQFAALIQKLHHGLIVSCQAPGDSPLHQPEVIAAMAEAAVMRGAVAVRIDSPEHVAAVRRRVNVPIIGLWKRQIVGCEVYITPDFGAAEAIAAAGADIVAIDGTGRERPGGEMVAGLIGRIQKELGKAVMADVDSLESARGARGADLVGTTLYGYTAETAGLKPPGFELLRELVGELSVPVICEGGVASPEMARRALELGADAVVVGTAITGIDLLVRAYCAALEGWGAG